MFVEATFSKAEIDVKVERAEVVSFERVRVVCLSVSDKHVVFKGGRALRTDKSTYAGDNLTPLQLAIQHTSDQFTPAAYGARLARTRMIISAENPWQHDLRGTWHIGEWIRVRG